MFVVVLGGWHCCLLLCCWFTPGFSYVALWLRSKVVLHYVFWLSGYVVANSFRLEVEMIFF